MHRPNRFLLGASLLFLSACFETAGDPADGGGDGPIVEAPPPVTLSDESAFRFLQQATFGASAQDIEDLKASSFDAWFEDQLAQPFVPYTDRIRDESLVSFTNESTAQRLFWERAVHGDDQLRQRVAYALSQIIVVSMNDAQLRNNVRTYAVYLDLLQEQALGNYCQLVRDVSLNPAMGLFLTHLGNPRADEETGFVPDENYAREVMQLFTIGLENLDAQGQPTGSETYSSEDVQGLAAVFTGLGWADTDFFFPRVTDFNRYLPMESFLAQHEDAPKTFLGATIDLGNDAIVSVEAALDHLLAHPNVAPFISKQLIQKLVTSNPSPAYVGRVSQAFETGRFRLANGTEVGAGNTCDMSATVAAILMDEEARSFSASSTQGKIRSPILRLANLIRTFRVSQDVTASGPIPQAWILDRLEDSQYLGINAYVSPSVFNFFRPGYVGPGTESAAAGLLTPEYQIATTPSLVGYINTIEDFIDGPPLSESEANVALMNISELLVIADEPATLVQEIDRLLTGGLMSPQNRSAIQDAVALVEVQGGDIDNDRRRRVEMALLMTVTSPEFMVQR